VLDGFLYCRKCQKVLTYSQKNSSNLSRHKCCTSLKDSICPKTVDADDKKAAAECCVRWITEDCRPFSSVNGSGFSKLVKFFIKIGAKYGDNIDIGDLLPDATTISRNVKKLAEEKKNEIKTEITDVIKSGGASATIDLWTDNYVHRHFLGVTLHYEKDLQLLDIVLGMKSMDFERATGDNILSKLKSLFREFEISNIDNIKFVTDRGSNVIKALQNNVRMNCSSHLFASVLEHSFKETKELNELVEACKKIVKYFKKANLQHQLQTSLKNECPTRWNSNFTMFKSIVDNWFQINEILNEKKETQRLLLISTTTLKQLVDLCGGFEVIFKKLQLCSSPSLCFVIPSINKVNQLCEIKDTDVPGIITLKERIKNNISRIWLANLNIWHKTAFFLYPPALKMQPTNIDDIKDFCIERMSSMDIITPTLSSPSSIAQSPATTCSVESGPTIAESTDQSSFDESYFFFPGLVKRTTSKTAITPLEEINRYCMENVELNDDFDILKWWKVKAESYPYLSKLALQVHSIPASSAAAERSFSLTGNVITEKRSRLVPKSVDSLIFLHSYYKNFNNE